MGLRDAVPFLMLRLGRDQEAYDFIKWWRLIDDNPTYDWGDTSLPYLDTKDADIFEPVEYLHGKYASSHIVAATLIKLKLALDLRSLDRTVPEVGTRVPPEIWDNIRRKALLSPVLLGKKDVMAKVSNADLAQKLGVQMEDLFNTVHRANPHMWPTICDPGDHLTARPACYGMGTIEEAQISLKWSYDAWAETPGAIDVLKTMLERVRRRGGQVRMAWSRIRAGKFS
jgi:hypothetical protein